MTEKISFRLISLAIPFFPLLIAHLTHLIT
jgi:hypothetical protein